MMTRDELIAETECECQLGGGPGKDRKEMTRRESVRRDVEALYARLEAAEKCIKAADVALEPALEVRTWNMMSKTSRDDIDTFSIARAAWEATK